MLIEWYGHSCFRISSGGYAVVLDPYKPNMIPGLGDYRIDANGVLCSHGHADHNYVQTVNIQKTQTPNPFKITFLDTFHDDAHGEKRGPNKITILEVEGLKVAHFGDLGTTLTREQYNALSHLDAVMIPVGGYFTIDAKTAKSICDTIKPKVIIPMHYSGPGFGPSVIGPVTEFTRLFDPMAVKNLGKNMIEILPSMTPQVSVLTYR